MANPKFEYRSTKQIRMFKIQNVKGMLLFKAIPDDSPLLAAGWFII
jgi:hypothetical protein